MFGRLYLGELKKLIRPKAIITISVLFLVFFVAYAVVYQIDMDEIFDSIADLTGSEEVVVPGDGEAETPEGFDPDSVLYTDYIGIANADNVDALIAALDTHLKDIEKIVEEDGASGYDWGLNDTRCAIAMLKYMKSNNLYGDIAVEGYTTELFTASAEEFALSYFQLVASILLIYGIVIAAGLYADEYSKGTIKLIMLRPVSRNMLTTAKLLAVFSHILGILGIVSLISYIYGAIAFDVTSTDKVYVVFNMNSVFQSTRGGVVFYKMFFATIEVLAYISLSYTLGTVLRKKTPAIVISILISLGVFSWIFGIFDLDMLSFSASTDLSVYFGYPGNNLAVGSNFFVAMGMLIAYLAAIFVALFVSVNRRDVV